MNETTLKGLKIVVEQAVRPVRATTDRKRRIREELLAHLVAIFEEESQRLDNDQAALAEAKSRFGNPKELTAQLQDTVPRWNRLARLGEIGAFRGPHESLRHFAGRMAILSTTLSAIAMLVLSSAGLCVALVAHRRPRDEPGAARIRGLFCPAVARAVCPAGPAGSGTVTALRRVGEPGNRRVASS